MGVSPLAGTELDTSGRGGGGGWKKWLPAAALASSFLPIPGVGGWLPKLIGLLGGAASAQSTPTGSHFGSGMYGPETYYD